MKTREPFLFSLLKVLFLCTDCANILGTCEKNVALCTDSAYLNLMKQYCKQTCGYCGNGTIFKPSSQPHLFSSFDHNISLFYAGCVDKSQDCNNNAALCTNSAYLKLMEQQCKKTCGYCSSSVNCNLISKSFQMLQKSLCTEASYQNLMKKACQFTCNLC
ncbi:unnamed protein product [Enterobius vermicularis]|uniref:ShKT domain-containing protein n=1 Tax=Enterobius vermicularis TaxID=51028 RepID=A0A0N4UTQ6_ENTVE|nr:unnamed protein product [Enterobius vermicularis]